VKETLTEEDIQWLAKIIAMIPVLTMPPDIAAKLLAHELISKANGRWEITDKGVDTIVNWKSPE
jgi:hypothetical protein